MSKRWRERRDLLLRTRSRRTVLLGLLALGCGGALPAVPSVLGATTAAAAGSPTYSLQGGWQTGYEPSAGGAREPANGTFDITAMNMSTGAFSGTAVVEGTSFAVQGTESGAIATYTLSEGGYVADDTLNLSVQGDGNVGGDGSFTDGGSGTGYFWAELTSPTGTTTTTTTTTTTPTTPTTTTRLDPTGTVVQCDFYVASAEDICTATVGDSTGNGSTATGQVSFAGDRSGACGLQATPSSPGVAACSITVPGSETGFLNITATYAGDATHATSNGSTQFLTAAPGSGLYDPTIGQFNPPTLQFTTDNPVSGSTLTGLGTLTGVSAEGQTCEVPSSATTSLATAAAVKARTFPQLMTSVTVRHARKGKVKLKLRFNQAKLRKLFAGTHTATLRIAVTIAPPHRISQTVVTDEQLTVHVPKHGRIRITGVRKNALAAHAALRAHQAQAPPTSLVLVFDRSLVKNGTSCGSLHLQVTIPPASDPARLADVHASLTGSITDDGCNNKLIPVSVDIDHATSKPPYLTGTVYNQHGDNITWTADSASAEISGFFAPPDPSCPPYGIDVLLYAPSSGG
jgi:hypothetical protein